MFQVRSSRITTAAAFGLLMALWGGAQAEQGLQSSAAAAFEVRVLEAQVPPDTGQGERYSVTYRMEVMSVLRSKTRVKPGETIVVRSYGLSNASPDSGAKAPTLLSRGWMGVAYLAPDPNAAGPDAGLQFVVAAEGDSFADLDPAPPSATWIEYQKQ